MTIVCLNDAITVAQAEAFRAETVPSHRKILAAKTDHPGTRKSDTLAAGNWKIRSHISSAREKSSLAKSRSVLLLLDSSESVCNELLRFLKCQTINSSFMLCLSE